MKFIKKFVGLTFVLSMLVACFMSSTMVAHADKYVYCSQCGRFAGWDFQRPGGVCSFCLYSDSSSLDGGGSQTITHTHSYPTGTYSAYTYQDATYHYRNYTQTCSCGDVKTTKQTAGHSWSNRNPMQYQQISGNAYQHQYKQYCTVCGGERWVNTSHSYQWTNEYRSISGTQHQCKQVCSQCGYENWVTQTCYFSDYNPMVYREIAGNINHHEYQQHCNYCTNTRWPVQSHSWQAQNNPTITAENRDTVEMAYRSISDTQCERKYICSTCKAVKWMVTNHSWNQADPYQPFNETQHANSLTCKNCSFRKVEYQKQNHSWTNTTIGDSDGHETVKACNVCGYIQGEGTMSPHNWGNWSYSTKDGVKTGTRTCSVCKYIDQTMEIVCVPKNIENAVVISETMTLDQIKANAGTTLTTPEWKAALSPSGEFDSSKAAANYAWKYNNKYYGLAKHYDDDTYYVVWLPSYYAERIKNYNPNYDIKPGSGSTYSGSYTTNTNAPSGYVYGNTSTAYGKADHAIWSAALANPKAPLKSSGGYSYIPVSNPSRSQIKSGAVLRAPNGQYVKADGKGNPTLRSTGSYYSHSCSWSTSYREQSATQHKVISRSCCGGYQEKVENHNYGNWTYTDLGPELHRAERY